MGGHSKPCLAVVVFSKDRPCQLLTSLTSLRNHILGATLDITVLFKASCEKFRESYDIVRRLLSEKSLQHSVATPQAQAVIHWDEEDDMHKVGDLLEAALARVQGKSAVVLFTVDDALWVSDFQADVALQLLHSNARVYAVHAKLCPRIEYAHPNDKFMRVPPLSHGSTSSNSNTSSDLLLFERSSGEYDWNYPWELSASMYRLDAVKETLEAIRTEFGRDAVHHPNHIEGYGVRLLRQEKLASANCAPLCACPCNPVVMVVTINRVQSLFDNPVYQTPGHDLAEVHPLVLDELLRARLRASGRHLLASNASEELPEDDVALELSKLLDTSPAFLLSYWHDAVVPAGFAEALAAPSWPPTLLEFKESKVYRRTYLDSVHVPLLLTDRVPNWLEASILVSWLMPVKDTPAKWLQDAFDSIRSQHDVSPGSWELIVADDGSETCKSFGSTFINKLQGLHKKNPKRPPQGMSFEHGPCKEREETLQVLSGWRALPNAPCLAFCDLGGCV